MDVFRLRSADNTGRGYEWFSFVLCLSHTPSSLFVHRSVKQIWPAFSHASLLTDIMSKSDFPPGYDESRGPLYAPQDGPYPPPPAYGFPAYGGFQPDQPSAPYPSGPNAPMYPGQPAGYPPGPYPGQPHHAGPPGAGYPPGPYPGQPHHAGPPGAGYPMPPPMPPMMPPTMPSDVLSSGKSRVPSMSVCFIMELSLFWKQKWNTLTVLSSFWQHFKRLCIFVLYPGILK